MTICVVFEINFTKIKNKCMQCNLFILVVAQPRGEAAPPPHIMDSPSSRRWLPGSFPPFSWLRRFDTLLSKVKISWFTKLHLPPLLHLAGYRIIDYTPLTIQIPCDSLTLDYNQAQFQAQITH